MFKALKIRLCNDFLNFKNCTDANIAIIFSLALIPILLAIAMAIDYTNASDSNAKLQSAADASSLAALSYVRSVPTPDSSTIAKAQAIAESTFNLQTKNVNTVTSTNPTFKITQTGTSFKSDVNYDATLKTMLGSAFGIDEMSVKGGASAVLDITPSGTTTGGTIAKYVNIYFMLDVSASMGIGATQSDIDILYGANGCAFACHQSNSAEDTFTSSRSIRPVAPTLRHDVLNQSVARIVNEIKRIDPTNAYVKVAGYSFDNKIENFAPLTSDLTKILNNLPEPNLISDVGYALTRDETKTASKFGDALARDASLAFDKFVNDPLNADYKALLNKLLAVPALNDGTTHFNTLISNVESAIDSDAGGDGSSKDKPLKIFVLASDGVQDPSRSWFELSGYGEKNVDVFDMSFCERMKRKNITVSIVHTPIVPVAEDYIYAKMKNLPVFKDTITYDRDAQGKDITYTTPARPDKITPAFQKCADKNYILASGDKASTIVDTISSNVLEMLPLQASKMRLIR